MRSFAAIAAAVSVAVALTAGTAEAQLEKSKVSLAVGGRSTLVYLPITIAQQRGYFREQGLEVEIFDVAGGSRAYEASLGGNVDLVVGVYQHVLSLQAQQQYYKAFTLLTDNIGVGIILPAEKAKSFKSFADFKGLKVGVTAPGSGSHQAVLYLLSKAGLGKSDISAIGVGTGSTAVAAMRSGKVDAMSMTEPAITALGDSVAIVANAMTKQGAVDLFGGAVPSISMAAKETFIAENPKVIQAVTTALVKALLWMRDAKPSEIADSVPSSDLQGGRDLYERAFQSAREMYSFDGLITEDGAKRVLSMLEGVNSKVDPDKIDLKRSYTNAFVEQALKQLKAKQ